MAIEIVMHAVPNEGDVKEEALSNLLKDPSGEYMYRLISKIETLSIRLKRRQTILMIKA